MNIREALGQIASLPYIGNKAGSIRSVKDFENTVTNIMRNVGNVVERPNGTNGYPSFTMDGIDFMVKTSKGKSPMWNESYVREDTVLILNLSFGTVVVHGSLITNSEIVEQLIAAKDYVAKHLREKFPKLNEHGFNVSGGRVQFSDNIDWKNSRISYLNETVKILEEVKSEENRQMD